MSMRDIGLYVEYDGKKNVVIGNGEVKEDPIGGMACEFSRLHPTDIKDYIMKISLFSETDLKEHGGEALMELFELIEQLKEVADIAKWASFLKLAVR